jgi:hypothetical protein
MGDTDRLPEGRSIHHRPDTKVQPNVVYGAFNTVKDEISGQQTDTWRNVRPGVVLGLGCTR